MEALYSALTAYALTIFFALLVAGAISLLAGFVKRLGLKEEGEPAVESIPAPIPSEKLRVAIAIAALKSKASQSTSRPLSRL